MVRKKTKNLIYTIVSAVVALGIGLVGGNTVLKFTTNDDGQTEVTLQSDFKIVLSEQQVPTEIETAEGTVEVIEAPTVESVDAVNQTDCKDGEEECGLGKYIYAPTGTPQEFKNYVYGGCWNTDDFAGAQCWDLGDLFFQNYAGRRLSTCGTGAAKGTWAGDCKYINAGNEYELIYDATKLQAGDWVVFNNGTWGHIGMALGGYNKGYVALLGQNQGGNYCEGGGSSANIINISLGSFAGAFRPKAYIPPEPEPTPTPTPEPTESCDVIEVKKGDTLGEIMKRCEGEVKWGEAMNEYAKSWKSTKYAIYPTVYDGWVSTNGVGLFAGDTIERIK